VRAALRLQFEQRTSGRSPNPPPATAVGYRIGSQSSVWGGRELAGNHASASAAGRACLQTFGPRRFFNASSQPSFA